jgi:hypothetical protein
MDSPRRATFYQQDNTILAVIRKGYKTFDEIIKWFEGKDNYSVLSKLGQSDCEYKVVYIPDGTVELTPDRIVLAKTIILQNIRWTYHSKRKIYMFIQCKWCHHISQARFVRPFNASEIRLYYTKYCPLMQDKCQIHWGSYDKVTVVNSPSTAIVIDDNDNNTAAPERPYSRRRRVRPAAEVKPYCKPIAVVTPQPRQPPPPPAQPYTREQEPEAQDIIRLVDIPSSSSDDNSDNDE